MGVHRQGERRGAAVTGERAQHGAELGIGRAAAAKLAWHAGRENIPFFELGEIFCDEGIIGVATARALREAGTDLMHQRGPIHGLVAANVRTGRNRHRAPSFPS